MYNKIILAGNLTRDIEVRYTQSGSAIANTAIATSRKYKGNDGQQKEEVLFVDITFFGRTAEIANQYLRKGSKILVDGRLKLDQWTAQDGTKRTKHSVIVESLQMLGSKDDAQGQGGNTPSDNQGGGYDESYGAPQGNHGAPASNQTAQNPQQQTRTPQAQPNQGRDSIPEIDIEDDDIPF